MTPFEKTALAHRNARERAAVAAAMEADLLDTAIRDAREQGMSIRQTSAALDVPKSTIARHWDPNHGCTPPLPHWGSETEWKTAHKTVWAHDPIKATDPHIPYRWIEHEGQRILEVVPRDTLDLFS